MRVLHVIPSVAPRYGGPSYAVAGYCRALAARGVEVVIATTNADGEGVLPVPTGRATDHHGIETWFFPRHGEAFKYSPMLARWLRASVQDFDLVHVHAVFSHSSVAAGRACRVRRVPYILRPLGSLDPWSLSRQAWKKRLLLSSAVGTLISRAAGMHYTTADEQRLAQEVVGQTPGMVIPLGVDDALLGLPALPSAQRQPRLVALCRLHPKKQLELLIQSFQEVVRTPGLSGWTLTIAGTGEAAYADKLKQLAQKGPAASRITLTGWVEGHAKTSLLRESALFAAPSHQENFGLGALEALACGVPVILTPGVNIATEVAEAEAGWLADATAASFTETLRRAMVDTTERARRSANARRFAEGYGWDRAAVALLQWYTDIIFAAAPATETC